MSTPDRDPLPIIQQAAGDPRPVPDGYFPAIETEDQEDFPPDRGRSSR